jgi:Outer membrane protein beta-barrel domain
MSRRLVWVLAAMLLVAANGDAQTGVTVQVVRRTVVMDTPRGDGLLLGSLDAGKVVEVLAVRENWYLVNAPKDAGPEKWRRGWIHGSALAPESVSSIAALQSAQNKPPPAHLMLRGFGEAGGVSFLARNSFEAILDSRLGPTYGGGGQVTLPNGIFVQAQVDRFRKTGTRAIVSGTQVFRLVGVPDTVTVTPLQLTVGYRQASGTKLAGYAGGGAGSITLKESSQAGTTNSTHAAYHAMVGLEYRLIPGVWAAGEVQVRSAPKALGSPGIGALFDEQNLGGTTFVFKVFVGR